MFIFIIDNLVFGVVVEDIVFVDNLLVGMVVVDLLFILNECGLLVNIIVIVGSGIIILIDGILVVGDICIILVNVISIIFGVNFNIINDFIFFLGNSGMVFVNFMVEDNCFVFIKSFSFFIINIGECSMFIFMIDNIVGGIDFLGVSFIDQLFDGMVIVLLLNLMVDCGGIMVIVELGISMIFVVFNFLIIVVVGVFCLISVDVIGEILGLLVNIIDNFFICNNFF